MTRSILGYERYKLNVTPVINPINLNNLLDQLLAHYSSGIDNYYNNSEKVNEVNEGLIREVIEKLAIMREKLIRVNEVNDRVTGVKQDNEENTNEHSKPNIEHIKKELRETLSLSRDGMNMKAFLDLLKERHPELSETERDEVIRDLRESGEFVFDYTVHLYEINGGVQRGI